MSEIIKKLLQRKSEEKDAAKAHLYDTLTRDERRQIAAAVARAKKTDKKEKIGTGKHSFFSGCFPTESAA